MFWLTFMMPAALANELLAMELAALKLPAEPPYDEATGATHCALPVVAIAKAAPEAAEPPKPPLPAVLVPPLPDAPPRDDALEAPACCRHF